MGRKGAFQMDDAEFQVLKERAHYGDAKSQYELGQMYLRGSDNVACSPQTAETWFNRAASQGHPEAQYAMGEIARKDSRFNTAAAWYERAAENGHANAQYQLGRMYRDGKGVEKSPEQAAHWFLLAAEQGDDRAKYEIGLRCMRGDGVPQSYELAAEWFAAAADSVPAASYFLGCLYRDGKGVERSYPEAVRLLRAAADRGNKFAMHELGRMYKAGFGVDRSYPVAAQLFSMAADKGNAKSMYELARLLLEPGWDAVGWAGEADPTNRAAGLLLQAAEGGHEKSIDELRSLAKEGSGQAMYCVARLCVDGKIQGKSDQEVADLLLSAHSKGCPDALGALLELAERTDAKTRYAVGRSLQRGACSDEDKRAAVRLLRLSVSESQAGALYALEDLARAGNPEAMYELGCLCRDGAYVPKSEQKATDYLSASLRRGCSKARSALADMADKGSADALYALYQAYAAGSGVEKSAATAAKYCRKLAEKGHVPAMRDMGGLYERGEGVGQSEGQAAVWYGRFIKACLSKSMIAYEDSSCTAPEYRRQMDATRDGDLRAMCTLGHMHQTGQGADKSEVLAALWYAEAACHKDSMAIERLGSMAANGQNTALNKLTSLANQWDPHAQYLLGMMYLKGNGVKESKDGAISWLTRAAKQGHAGALDALTRIANDGDVSAQYELGTMYLDSKWAYEDKSEEKATEWLTRAARQNHAGAQELLTRDAQRGNVHAQYELGMMYLKGNGAKESKDGAISWLTRAAKQGHAGALDTLTKIAEDGDARAEYELGMMYLEEDGVERSDEKAAILLAKAAELGHTGALNRLSMSANLGEARAENELDMTYLCGESVEMSSEKAREPLDKAAGHGRAGTSEAPIEATPSGERKRTADSPQATVEGISAASSDEPSEEERDEPVRESEEPSKDLSRDEDDGRFDLMLELVTDPRDLNALGDRYYDGDGVRRSLEKAFKAYAKGAEAGDMRAQNSLGCMYEEGEFAEQSITEAARWYREAAEQGLAMAQYNLANLYFNGVGGVSRSYPDAVKLFRLAAEGGDADAQYSYGRLFEAGLGVKRSWNEAMSWYDKAARQGNGDAKRRLSILLNAKQESDGNHGEDEEEDDGTGRGPMDEPMVVDPVNEPWRPLRRLFEDGEPLKTADAVDKALGLFPGLHGDGSAALLLLDSDPLVTWSDGSYKLNWRGADNARDVLRAVLRAVLDSDPDSPFEELLDEVFAKCSPDLERLGILSTGELCSFLCFCPAVSADASLDPLVLAQLLDAVNDMAGSEDSDDADIDFPQALELLGNSEGYWNLPDLAEEGGVPPEALEDLGAFLDSRDDVTSIGGLYKGTRHADPRTPFLPVWPVSGEHCSVPGLFKANEGWMRRSGIDDDYRLGRLIEDYYPECLTGIWGVADARAAGERRREIMKPLVDSRRVGGPVNRDKAATPPGLLEYVSESDGTLSTDEASEALGIADETLVRRALNSLQNVVMTGPDKGKALKASAEDVIGLLEGLSPESPRDEQSLFGIGDWNRLGVESVDELHQVLLKVLPECMNPVSRAVDLSILGPPKEPESVPSECITPEPPPAPALGNDATLVYDRIKTANGLNFFRLKRALPDMPEPALASALDELYAIGAVERTSTGISAVPGFEVLPPNGKSSDDSTEGGLPLLSLSPESCISLLENMEGTLKASVIDSVGHDPRSQIKSQIAECKDKKIRRLLEELILHNENSPETMAYDDKVQVTEFCKQVTRDTDRELFSTFDIPSNLFLYLFNRSPEYLTALSLSVPRGKAPATDMIESILEGNLHRGSEVRRYESSNDAPLSLRERLLSMFDGALGEPKPVIHNDGSDAVLFLLFLLNDSWVSPRAASGICGRVTGSEVTVDTNNRTASDIPFPDFVATRPERLKMHSSENVLSMNSALASRACEGSYNIGALYEEAAKDLGQLGIDDEWDFRWLIDRMGLVKKDGERLRSHFGLEKDLRRFALKEGIDKPSTLAGRFSKRFGGNKKDVLEACNLVCGNLSDAAIDLGEDTIERIDAAFSGDEWVTKTHAQSMVEDKLGLAGAFSDSLMSRMGFANSGDVYFRKEYKNFVACLLENEFSGEDLQITGEVKTKLECQSFKIAVEGLCAKQKWIHVGGTRMINLEHPKFQSLQPATRKFARRAKALCEQGFLTAWSLMNMESGIPEIDGDDFGVAFYEDILLASKVNKSMIEGVHFFHDASDGYPCSMEGFVRFIVTEECDGKAYVNEVQRILLEEYRIKADETRIRSCAKDHFLYDRGTDSIYASEERYMEDMNYE